MSPWVKVGWKNSGKESDIELVQAKPTRAQPATSKNSNYSFMISASVSWPAAPLTDSLVRQALQGLSVPVEFVNSEILNDSQNPLQWSTYDEIDHELTLSKRDTLLSSSYTFRKALIRKHFLSWIIKSYLTKKPNSILNWASPRTFELEISFADELDEMWTDELWELGSELDTKSSWWILKP
jgi:tubulin--tyrosine ligase